MKLTHIPKEQLITNSWNGGTTTEITIYPANASFIDRNFLYRISTATVEKESTVFTKFNEYSRELMILKGELEITHEGRYSKILKPFETDSFEGDWETSAKGKVTDFNIIYKGKVLAQLDSKLITSKENFTESIQVENAIILVYVATGFGIYQFNEQTIKIKEGDSILLEHNDNQNMALFKSEGSMHLVLARVWY